ncbi:MAG: prephenate dehydrogenase/arogenate dehydrogenase family protein [Coriobacteriia bacterium]|nr:prephenate dehydrogenase/arogenate dehydrogenase family protein [Coriobacteriia bacterium]
MVETMELGEERGQAGLPFSSVLVIGVGLIGGSVAAALKALEGAQPYVRGVDISAAAIEGALSRGYLDEGAVLGAGAGAGNAGGSSSADADDKRIIQWLSDETTDLVVLATPVSGAEEWFERLETSGYTGAITDVASTKGVLTGLAQRILSQPERYIPGHPMAGSEVNGIEGARATLFQNAHWILCPNQDSDPDIYAGLHELVTSLGARSISLPREEHDETIAVVSHVPHMVASALVSLAGSYAKDKQEIFRLAAGGFKDTTRIAAGSPELWCGIALDNREALAQGLGEIKEIIGGIELSLHNGNAVELKRLLAEAARLRSSIPATWVPDSARLVEVRIPMANHTGVIAQVTGFAGKANCNIQSINIDHINEATAILELILTDEGDKGRFMSMLIDGGFDVSFRPLGYNVQ